MIDWLDFSMVSDFADNHIEQHGGKGGGGSCNALIVMKKGPTPYMVIGRWEKIMLFDDSY